VPIYLLAFVGGVLTMSPCILPVLPFVFAHAGQPFRRTAVNFFSGSDRRRIGGFSSLWISSFEK
jgi:cytochrome c biogenesis protein CcdA